MIAAGQVARKESMLDARQLSKFGGYKKQLGHKMVEAAGIEPASERLSQSTSTRLFSKQLSSSIRLETGTEALLGLSPRLFLNPQEKKQASLFGSSVLSAQTGQTSDGAI